MDKYTIASECTAISDTTISFTVAAYNPDGYVSAYGSVLVNSDMHLCADIKFYCKKEDKQELYNKITEHCKKRAKIPFKYDSKKQKKGSK